MSDAEKKAAADKKAATAKQVAADKKAAAEKAKADKKAAADKAKADKKAAAEKKAADKAANKAIDSAWVAERAGCAKSEVFSFDDTGSEVKAVICTIKVTDKSGKTVSPGQTLHKSFSK